MTLWLKLLLAALTLGTALFTFFTGPARRKARIEKERKRKKRELRKAIAEGDEGTVSRLTAELRDSL